MIVLHPLTRETPLPMLYMWVEIYQDCINSDSISPDGLVKTLSMGLSEVPTEIVATENSHPVGIAQIQSHLLDDSGVVSGMIYVRPEYRRRGIGILLLREMQKMACAQGAQSIIFVASSIEDERFLLNQGGKLKENTCRYQLVVSERTLRQWKYIEAPRGYDFTFVLNSPSDTLSELLGQCNWEDMSCTDSSNLSPLEELSAPVVLNNFVAYASLGDEIVGFTSLRELKYHPNRLYQGFTSIDPAHQGRGVASYLKSFLILHTLRSDPRYTLIETETREENATMIHINEKLGFQQIGFESFIEINCVSSSSRHQFSRISPPTRL